MMKNLASMMSMSLLLLACGGDDSGGDDDDTSMIDGSVVFPDAPTMVDAAPTCSVPASITITASDMNAAALLVPASGGNPERYIVNYITGAGTQGVDEFFQFRVNQPVSLNTPLDLSNSCTQGSAFCWVLLGNYTVANNMLDGDVYFGLQGTMTITQADAVGGSFKANFTGVKFTHYIDGGGGLVPANDGCEAVIADGSIDLMVAAPQKPGQTGHLLQELSATDGLPFLP